MIEYKITYCKKCGGQIDNRTKICMSCGKQYMTKSRMLNIVLMILCLSMSFALIYQIGKRKDAERITVDCMKQAISIDRAFTDRFGTYTNPATGEAITGAQSYLDALDAQMIMDSAINTDSDESSDSTTDSNNNVSTSELKNEVDQLNKQKAAMQLMIDDDEADLKWYSDNVALVDTYNNSYHTINCMLEDKNLLKIMSVKDAEAKGYSRCKGCED